MRWDKAVHEILENNGSVTAIVGNRIFPNVAEQGVEMPLIVYSLIFNEPQDTKDSHNDCDKYSIQITCHGRNWDNLGILKKSVKTALERYKGTVTGAIVHNCYFISEDTIYNKEDEVYMIVFRFEIWLKQYTYYYVINEVGKRVIDGSNQYVVATNF